MEEFIEKFNEFKDYLYDYEKEISVTTEGISVYIDIINKFTELELDKVF